RPGCRREGDSMSAAGKAKLAGPSLEGTSVRRQLEGGGMDCPSCAGRIERGLSTLPGVRDAEVNFAAGRVAGTYEPNVTSLEAVAAAIERLGHSVERETKQGEHAGAHDHEGHSTGRRWALTAIAGLAVVAAFVLERTGAPGLLWRCLYGISILLGGLPVIRA